jgi:tight adherence protein C
MTLPISVILGIAFVAAVFPLMLWSLIPADPGGRKRIRANLARGRESVRAADAAPPDYLGAITLRLTLPANRSKLDQLHALAGRPAAWTLPRVLLIKPVLALGVLLFGLLLLSAKPTGGLTVLVVLVTVVAYFVPDLLLYSRGIERQTAIGLALPDTLDQMLIAVEAGLGFEASMARAGENGTGPLADELVRTLQDMRVGMSRKEAYQALAERTSVPDLRAFIRAVVQADAYGISISAVLRTQAKEMRLKRRQRAEEKAMQIPVKVLFPLMLFILPVLFIAVLGPTVITMMATFS